MPWPRRLADGTYSRNYGWAGETDVNSSFVWADDQFMGCGLLGTCHLYYCNHASTQWSHHAILARLAVATGNAEYAHLVAEQQSLFASHLLDPLFEGTPHIS